MTDRLIRVMLAAGTGLLLGGQLVIAADRIDLFDTNSNRTGYDKDGNRVGSGILPVPGGKR